MRKILAADLFCGAGGSSSGLHDACDELGLSLDLLAINHWDIAIATHSANHPDARHLCENLDSVNPRNVVRNGRLNILIASPECTHHSRARGGKPMSDQSRASAWHVLRWAEALRIDNILIENVREFREWGPLGTNGLPLKKRKGETYQAFLNALRSLGYAVEDRVLNCANYGDPTTRERLFILAKRGNKKVRFPEPTHTPTGESLFGKTDKWRAAREIIDWSVPGESIFTRKRPLSPNTLKRIEAGLKKFGGASFVLPLEGFYRGNAPRSIDQPIPTVTRRGAGSLVQPFILNVRGGNDGYTRASSIDAPLPTVTTSSPTALVEPFIVEYHGGVNSHNRVRSVDEPLPTQDTSNRFGLAEPFIVTVNHGKNDKRSYSTARPLPTMTGKNQFALVEPFVIGQQSGSAPRSVDQPLPTVAGKGAIALVIPKSDGAMLDIRFRMLQPHELARAMSFPEDYEFTGTREQQVKQIGNAVPRMTAKALCMALLGE